MTQLQLIREDYEHLIQSETVRFYLRRGVDGKYISDIFALDRGIRELHTRCRKAEHDAWIAQSEVVFLRRKLEALEIERREEEENRFPLFNPNNWGNENQHPETEL